MWGRGKSAAVLMWVALFFLLSGLVVYLLFAAPPEPPRRSFPVTAGSLQPGIRNNQEDKGDHCIDYGSQGY